MTVGRMRMGRIRLRIIWLLLACFCLPVLSSAQAPQVSYTVSVRELNIPPKARQAFRQGIDLLEKKDPTASLPHFQRAISEFANFYEAYYVMGVANLKLWRTAEAEQAFRKSIELSGGQYAQPLLALGAVLDYQDKFAEAEEVSRKGLELAPTNWSGHYSLSWALFNLNRLEEAEQSVREALRWKSDYAEAYLLLADIHHRRDDYPALLNDLDEYLELKPDSPINGKARSLRDKAVRRIVESRNASAIVQPKP